MADRILIVEDEPAIVTMLQYNLEKEGYSVSVATDGEMALASVEEETPSLILLDWMLPKMTGIEVCRQLRKSAKNTDIPIIMVTARGEEADKVQGLQYGADDYITKPFSIPELNARIRAVLRRTGPIEDKGCLDFKDLHMDLTSHKVTRGSREVLLGPTEFRLLKYLMTKPKHVFSREELLRSVWGASIHVEVRTVDVHIRRLRKALNDGGEPDMLRTVRSAGYAIDTEASDETDED